MFKKSFGLILGLFILVLAGGYFLGVTKDPRPQSVGLLHKPMPPLDLPLLEEIEQDGGETTGEEAKRPNRLTHADFKGRQVILHFFASWCKYCRDEHATIEALADRPEIVLYGINIHDRREDVLGWLSKAGNPYGLIGFDEKGVTSKTWGVMATPQTFVIDKAGVVIYQYSGSLTAKRLQEEILPLFKDTPS